VVDRLNKSAQNEILNIAALFIGLTIGSTMNAQSFLNLDTLQILALGLVAFTLDTVAGMPFGKLLSDLSGRSNNPLIGAVGISAFPMAGQLGSVMAGGVLLALVAGLT
jgi:oxaloacetate decarboxylase beta subunit